MTEWRSQLRILRHYHGLKQAVMAEMVGVDQATVSRWENGHQEPDLASRRRLRDLLRKFSTHMEVSIASLLASPIVDRNLMDVDFILREVSPSEPHRLKINKSDLIGQCATHLRDDPRYDALVRDHIAVLRKGEFTSVHSIFHSRRSNSWVETFSVPVLVSGKIHFLNERRLIAPPDRPEPVLRISLLEE